RWRDFLFALQAIDHLDHEEDRERDDEEVERRLQEGPIVDRHRILACLYCRQRHRQIREIDAADEIPQRRRDDVVHERSHDLAKGSADDDADCHVDDVAFHRELAEFFDEAHWSLPFWLIGLGTWGQGLGPDKYV